MSVLIISDHTDMHVPLVGRHLEAIGVYFKQLNIADFPLRVRLTQSYDGKSWASALVLPGCQGLNCQDIHSVWYRKPEPYYLPREMPPEQYEFAMGECREAIRGMYRSLVCSWIDWPGHVREASNKPYQLKLASAMGFKVPRTLITNNPSLVREFYNACKGMVVYKALNTPVLSHKEHKSDETLLDGILYTTPLEETHFAHIESVSLAPCLFQEYVPKKIELRITVVGSEVFAAAIHSQESPETMHDLAAVRL